MGDFSLLNFNFSLLSLVAPIPSAVDGYFGLKGKYSLANSTPQVTADLIIKDTVIYNRKIILDNGNILFKHPTSSYITSSHWPNGIVEKHNEISSPGISVTPKSNILLIFPNKKTLSSNFCLLIKFFALLIAFLQFTLLIIFLSLTVIFSKTCGT